MNTKKKRNVDPVGLKRRPVAFNPSGIFWKETSAFGSSLSLTERNGTHLPKRAFCLLDYATSAAHDTVTPLDCYMDLFNTQCLSPQNIQGEAGETGALVVRKELAS
mmetsp:Transcript_17041/g.33933  ORF Transcript_17041/g.33933 Transcript_17041/m.33933 type:complete len:106 (-) Transcript_17041:985-1302(-)